MLRLDAAIGKAVVETKVWTLALSWYGVALSREYSQRISV